MNNFCNQCGNPLNGKNKCDNCGHIVSDSVIDKISDTVKNYDYKGKAAEIKKQTDKFVDKAKEYDYKGKAEEIKEKTDAFIQSEQVQNIKNETIKRTHIFFDCNINNDEDFIKAQKGKNKCLYIIFISIAITIFLFPFYKEFLWLEGMIGKITGVLSSVGLISRIIIFPLVLIFGIKYKNTNKAINEYINKNIGTVINPISINKKIVLSVLIACIISVPIVNKITNVSYMNHMNKTISTNVNINNESTSSNDLIQSHEKDLYENNVYPPNENSYYTENNQEQDIYYSSTVAISNAIIIEDDHKSNVVYKNKCDSCGYVEPGTNSVVPGSRIGGFYCTNCNETKKVELKTTYSN